MDCVLSGVALWALFRWRMAERAANRRTWLDRMHGARSGTLGVGISALVTRPVTLERCERLLGEEYALFEVVVVLDGERDAVMIEQLKARYHLIQVEYYPTDELPVRGVRGLYRSRKRRFRRLVLVDCRTPGVVAALDAAAEVASYEYLLPLRADEYPVVGAVERLATEVALQPLGAIEQICYLPALYVVLWRRTALIRIGGFAHCSMRVVRRERCRWVWEMPLRREKTSKWHSVLVFSLLALLAAFVWWLDGGSLLRLLLWWMLLLLAFLCRLRVRQIAEELPVV